MLTLGQNIYYLGKLRQCDMLLLCYYVSKDSGHTGNKNCFLENASLLNS